MVIRHIGVWSVSRLYGALCGAMGLLFGIIVALIAMAGGSMAGMRGSDAGLAGSGIGALFGVGAIILLPLCYGVLGLVTGAIAAGLYNPFPSLSPSPPIHSQPSTPSTPTLPSPL